MTATAGLSRSGAPMAASRTSALFDASPYQTGFAAGAMSPGGATGRQAPLTMGPAIVRHVDPNGPSAAADIVPGDTVIIRTARRQNPPTPDVAITSVSLGAYTFGSSVVPSGSRTVTLEVRRSGPTRTVEVTPRLVRGGLRLSAKWEPSRASGFFTVVAPGAS